MENTKTEEIRKKKALVNMSLDDEMTDELTRIEKKLPELGFWNFIDKAISVIPSIVSIEIKINKNI